MTQLKAPALSLEEQMRRSVYDLLKRQEADQLVAVLKAADFLAWWIAKWSGASPELRQHASVYSVALKNYQDTQQSLSELVEDRT